MEGSERGKACCAMNEMLGLLNEEIMSLCNSDTAAESDLKKKKNCGRDTRLCTRENAEKVFSAVWWTY